MAKNIDLQVKTLITPKIGAIVVGIGVTTLAILSAWIILTVFSDNTTVRAERIAQGYWRAVAGDINISQKIGTDQIHAYDWYAIEVDHENQMRVIWDNGRGCTKTDATAVGDKILLVERGVLTTFVFKDATTATVTFRDGNQSWVKHLEKVRDDPAVICW